MTLSAILNVRKNSSRCPNKLLRNFAGTTLFDICCLKLQKLDVTEKYVCAYDYDFLTPAEKKYGLDTLRRSKESVSVDGPLTTVFEAVRSINTEYFMFINPCLVHMPVSTLQSAIDLFLNSNFASLTSVVCRKDWVYNKDGQVMIDGMAANGDTKKTQETYVVAHAFHIVNIDYFLRSNRYWSNGLCDPYLFEINKIEALDIDDEEDFMISEALYKSRIT